MSNTVILCAPTGAAAGSAFGSKYRALYKTLQPGLEIGHEGAALSQGYLSISALSPSCT